MDTKYLADEAYLGDEDSDHVQRVIELIAQARRELVQAIGPETFWPEQGEPVEPARSICPSCVVADGCLSYALEIDAAGGIFAGLSRRQGRLRRSQAA